MRITLKPGDVIPANAVFCSANLRDGMVVTDITVQVPDPVPAAPKMIVFVADGEPRQDSGTATHRIVNDEFYWCGKNDKFPSKPYQHYRQLPAEDTLTKEDLRVLCGCYSEATTEYQVRQKLRRIIAAMEARE